MRCVNLLERLDHGQIAIDGQTVFSGVANLRQPVGMVLQRFTLFPHLTAIENVIPVRQKTAGLDRRGHARTGR